MKIYQGAAALAAVFVLSACGARQPDYCRTGINPDGTQYAEIFDPNIERVEFSANRLEQNSDGTLSSNKVEVMTVAPPADDFTVDPVGSTCTVTTVDGLGGRFPSNYHLQFEL